MKFSLRFAIAIASAFAFGIAQAEPLPYPNPRDQNCAPGYTSSGGYCAPIDERTPVRRSARAVGPAAVIPASRSNRRASATGEWADDVSGTFCEPSPAPAAAADALFRPDLTLAERLPAASLADGGEILSLLPILYLQQAVAAAGQFDDSSFT